MYKENYFAPLLIVVLLSYLSYQFIGYNKNKTIITNEYGKSILISKPGFYLKGYNDHVVDFDINDHVVVNYDKTLKLIDGRDFNVTGEFTFILPKDEKDMINTLLMYRNAENLNSYLNSDLSMVLYKNDTSLHNESSLSKIPNSLRNFKSNKLELISFDYNISYNISSILDNDEILKSLKRLDPSIKTPMFVTRYESHK